MHKIDGWYDKNVLITRDCKQQQPPHWGQHPPPQKANGPPMSINRPQLIKFTLFPYGLEKRRNLFCVTKIKCPTTLTPPPSPPISWFQMPNKIDDDMVVSWQDEYPAANILFLVGISDFFRLLFIGTPPPPQKICTPAFCQYLTNYFCFTIRMSLDLVHPKKTWVNSSAELHHRSEMWIFFSFEH